MSSEFGKVLKVSIFGQSHGKAIGVLMDGLPSGEEIDMDALYAFLDRRKPGGALSTARREADLPVFLSGIANVKTCAGPLCAIIENGDARPGDYDELKYKPRPSHADYAAYVKWGGTADMSGGGHFSGRLTAPLCIAGGIARQLLARRGVYVGAHLAGVYGVCDDAFPLKPGRELFDAVAAKAFPVINDAAGDKMRDEIARAAGDMDSVGGVVECAITGVPVGLGGPMFDGVENRLSAAVFGIPAVKGLEFGAGFACASARGSANNDPFVPDGKGGVTMEKNDAGGILGGITSGMPIVFRAAFKPTPSIAKAQRTVDMRTGAQTELVIKGRHDPCIAHRAVPVVEAVAAIVMLDMMLEDNNNGNF